MPQQYAPGTALVVVDVQVDFADPAGGLYVAGGEDVVPLVNAEVDAAVAAGSPVVFTQDWHPEHTPHFAQDGGTWPVHCVAGTPGAELAPGLRVPEGASRVRKGTGTEDGYSGFSEVDLASGRTDATRLGALLQEAGVRRLVVVGLAGDHCVRATALDGARLGYDVTVPLAVTRFVALRPEDPQRARADMAAAGVHLV
ncbi:isochorismatase family protein [Quadrisphaera sp. DSM 44207]|uniref:isochorismatase family protein n=1 Tax=Quadrisphaera sp. DSM 44207 TaxID=1881057 RepID=UPI00088F2C3F|nr:isochorismatase family protein [Quadrisphaera sp. DSM 44207]SDQ73034.1 nicotinamidase/pyrazinamidase [Quadrisphaera sp. DSM 44207]